MFVSRAEFKSHPRMEINRWRLFKAPAVAQLNHAAIDARIERRLDRPRRRDQIDWRQRRIECRRALIFAAAHRGAKAIMKRHPRRSYLRIAKRNPPQHRIDRDKRIRWRVRPGRSTRVGI